MTHATLSQFTRAAGPWIPRLERLVESRNLCSFEKNILLTLIGAVLQPTKISLLSYGTRRSTISDLLLMLCTGLEERIHSLKYFRKNATLVREGMLVIYSPEISGDFTSADVSQ